MEKQLYAKIFTWASLALLVVSVLILIWGWATGFEANDGKAVNVLLGWGYIMLGLALAAVVLVGIYIAATTNPKSLIKMGIVVVGVIVVCFLAYLLASGSQPVGYTGATLPSDSELKLTDTILNLAYLLGGAAILSIVVGEIVMGVRNKKA
ncbi:MAG: hypothetical protein IKR69_04285 [Bacteroidales bacterium]|nr:hypothetical protein [Bacteroidales bacterium]